MRKVVEAELVQRGRRGRRVFYSIIHEELRETRGIAELGKWGNEARICMFRPTDLDAAARSGARQVSLI
jgi:hypothetical protein